VKRFLLIFALASLSLPALFPAQAMPCTNCDETPPPPPRTSCLAAGTLVNLADGKTMRVEQVNLQTRLVSLNKNAPISTGWNMKASRSKTGSSTAITYRHVAPNTHVMYQLTDSLGHQLTATDHHPIITLNRGAVRMDMLKPGDSLITLNGNAYVSDLRQVKYQGLVYNFTTVGQNGVFSNHTFFAQGILVGDLEMQVNLSSQNGFSVISWLLTPFESMMFS
jgi:hypothetical protein